MGDAPPTNVGLSDAAGVTLAGKIMVGTIITLFFVVAVMLCVHIYARLFLWRRSAAGAERRLFTSASADAAADSLSRGVDPAVLKSLPVVVLSATECEKGLECAVCLDKVSAGEKARMLPGCSHGFHVACIDAWLQSRSTCPLCRSPVSPQPSVSSAFTAHGGSAAEAVDDMQDSSSDEGMRTDNSLVIDIPRNHNLSDNCSSPSLRCGDPDEARSPFSSRLRSLSRLWSMNQKAASATSSSSTTDLDHSDARV